MIAKHYVTYGVGERWNRGTRFDAEQVFNSIDAAIIYIEKRRTDPDYPGLNLVIEVMDWEIKSINN